ncbi:MAG: lamin tail domain-containing protein, partial [Prevotellaceae bacterium]|nr:lamin tail domain-containing protein [Prevotellaceae bacterium]
MKPLFTTLFMLALWPTALSAQFSDNFESSSLTDWLQHPAGRWSVSTVTPLEGNASLKHSYQNTAAATDIIYRELIDVIPSESSCTWRFMLRHGFNPSGSNKWGVMLMANAPASEWRSGGTYQGYVIGVNMGSSTGDTLTLYAVRNNTYSIIRKTSINWRNNIGTTGVGAVEVVRTNDGQWAIRAAIGNSFDLLSPVAQPILHNTYTEALYFGLMYTHTTTASQLLWMDEVSLEVIPVEPLRELEYGDVVFSEIMAKADPSAGLPEVQYMELYNRSGRELMLDGWKIYYNNTIGNIGNTVMPDSSYLILCMSSMVPVMKDYGNA